MIYDLIIAGGGAAGMMAAITAAEAGKKVIIIEKMNQLGKKILATGNGRCNFTNSFLDETCYRSSRNRFPYFALEQFDHTDTLKFFARLGIAVTERNGYYYPRSNQAASIANALICKIKSLNIEVILGCNIDNIDKRAGIFTVSSGKRKFRGYHLLIAAGGKAQEKLGSDGSGFTLARKMGHTIIEPFPALTALEVKDHFLKDAAGVRCQCRVSAVLNEKVLSTEQGELQITKYGVSGVMIFQLSRYIIQGLREKKKAGVEIDFLPEIKDRTLFMNQIPLYSNYKNARQWLEGYFPSKLAEALLKKAQIRPEKKAVKLSENEKETIWNVVKRSVCSICGWKGFEFAQVTAGGVDVREVSPYTMESEIVSGLYFAGEVLDVDGTCGGYNLQWAWTSGYLAGRSIK